MIPGLKSDDIAQDTIWRFSLPSNFATYSSEAFKHSANVRLCLHANCIGMRVNKEGNHLVGLRVSSLRGNEFTVRAKYYVLAAGGLEVTRLMLASNDVCSDGIGNNHDLVGRFYGSHIAGELGAAVFTPKGGPLIWDYDRSHEGVYCRRALSIREPAQRREQLLNFHCILSHPPISDPAHGSSILSAAYLAKAFVIHKIPPEYSKDLAGHMTPYRRALPHLRNVVLGAPALIPFALKWGAKRNLARRKLPSVSLFNRNNVYSLHFDAEQSPNPQSRVTLTDERDALGVPRLSVDWRYSALDIASVAKILELIRRDFYKSGVATLQAEDGGCVERISTQLGVGSHHIGTTRMAAGPSRGVVDANCRVHGLDNLFIASSSIFPTTSFANPTLTIVAFAIRIADHLKQLAHRPG
jgi:choline dehydrogenase-like flavoprotein